MTSATAVLYPVVRGMIFVALLLLAGTAVASRILVTTPALTNVALYSRSALLARVRRVLWHLAWIIPTLILLRGALQVAIYVDPDTPLSSDLIQGVLLDGHWGHSWLLQLSAAALLLIVTWVRSDDIWQTVAWALGAMVIWAQTGMGHASGDAWHGRWGRVLDTAHILGAGIWLGTLGVLAIGIFPALQGAVRLPGLCGVVENFSRWARTGVLLVVGSGVTAAWTYAGTIHALVTSTWGQLLLAKVAGLLGVAALGWWNWRVTTPALASGAEHSPAALRRAVRAELIIALVMLAITAVLVATPLPMEH
jgi:putative copper export protein